ncbi:four helix bundle protein [Thiohalophilus sp.]|uniref:four helix bundle protein n=2 Tax=Thiohalophilus sp. TaxID=3028392 RepID=UPI002ACEAAC6|nr:four helix bundle protein [Thiohalophilus sp.]MDZ7803820.1 four helix bundle protein [Thiohalophilus sp.]
MDALESLDVWKRACRLSVRLYQTLADCREYSFKDQITRAALSVPSNIAEGYERETDRTRVQFFKIAKGSCGELRTQLMIGRAAGFIEAETGKEMEEEVREISRMIWGLIRHYQDQEDLVPRPS